MMLLKNFLKQNNIIIFLLVLSRCNSFSDCDFEEAKCINCTQYQKCYEGSTEDTFITCDNEKDCNDPWLEQCKWLLNCYASYALKAVDDCKEVGVFPDSSSETKFYVCLDDSNSGFIKLPFSCSKDEYFDKSTLQCVTTALTETEGTTISESSTAGGLTTSPNQPSSTLPVSTDFSTTLTEPSTTVSSITESSTPLSTDEPQSSIPSTTEFSTTDLPSTTVATEFPFTTTTSDTTTVFTTSEPSQTTSQPFICTSPGIFPDPSNCKNYFRCSTSLKKFSYVCPGKSFFNENILKCSLTVSPSCQEQISTTTTTPKNVPTTVGKGLSSTKSNEVSTPKPNSTPTTTTAFTPTSITTTTTITTTAKPFTCPGAGVFPNPDDCKTYFRCNSVGKIFVLSCPGSSSFNEITKSCSVNLSPRCQKK